MTVLFEILFNAFWLGIAALGFGILFNAPPRALAAIAMGGFVAGFVKFGILLWMSPEAYILASFLAALSIGLLSIPAAHWRHVTPGVLSVPPVIPLMPGVFAYKTMMGLAELTKESQYYLTTLSNTFHFGTLTLFIVLAIALGVSIPMHVLRANSVKNLRFRRK
jgi:uncharacterized membrane protein YjjB (DUF3815 family)